MTNPPALFTGSSHPSALRRGGRRVRWRRLALVLLVLSAAAYLTGASGIYYFDRVHKRNPAVRFIDVVLPSRWPNLRTARGEYFFREARLRLAEEKFSEALMLAGRGLELCPADRDGRLFVAKLRHASRGAATARQTLLEGLRFHADDAEFLKHVFHFLLRQRDDGEVIGLVSRLKAERRPGPDAARVLAFAAATAAHHLGHYDQAEDYLRSAPGLGATRDAALLATRIERERGYPRLALVHLQQIASSFPDDFEIHHELVAQLREVGREDEARRTSLTFQLAHPTRPEARVLLLEAYRRAGENARLAVEVESLLGDFATDLPALTALAEFGASAGEPALVRRVAEHAMQRRLPSEAFSFLAVEAAIVARDYRGAIDRLRELSEKATPEGRLRSLSDSLLAIAHLGLGDSSTAQIFLTNLLQQPNLPAENLQVVAARFAALDAMRPAWQVLQKAVAVDPLNQAALSRLIELDLTLNRVDELAGHLQRLLRMRRPSPDLLRVAERKMGSDLFLFSRDAPAAIGAARLALAESGAGNAR